MFRKGSYPSLTGGEKFKIAQHYYNHYKSFPLVFDVSVTSAQRQLVVIAPVFDIMQFKNMLEKCFIIAVIVVTS